MGMGIQYQAPRTLVAKKTAPPPAAAQVQPAVAAASNKYAVDSLMSLNPSGGGWGGDSDLGLDLDLVRCCYCCS